MSDEQPDPNDTVTPADTHNLGAPSVGARCAECGEAVGEEWVSYEESPRDKGLIVQRFAGFLKAGPVSSPEKLQTRRVRALRPVDLGRVFHRSCAPEARLSKKTQGEVADLLAKILVDQYQKTIKRWAGVLATVSSETTPPLYRTHVASAEGRRVFMMRRADWNEFQAYERRLVEIAIDRTPAGGLEAVAAAIAALAAECSLHRQRFEVWPYHAARDPRPSEVQHYLVLDDLSPRRLDLPKFAERASSHDSPPLRNYLRDHVFLVSTDREHGRREAKARALERIVFMVVN